MADPTTDNPRKAEPAGLFGHFSALIGSSLGYLRARLKLAGIEGKEAALHGGIILGLFVGALVAVIFGYFLLVIGVVFLVAKAFDSENAWMWVMLAAAGLHFAGAIALAFIAKAKLSTPLFPLTLEELQKDQEWLNQTTKRP